MKNLKHNFETQIQFLWRASENPEYLDNAPEGVGIADPERSKVANDIVNGALSKIKDHECLNTLAREKNIDPELFMNLYENHTLGLGERNPTADQKRLKNQTQAIAERCVNLNLTSENLVKIKGLTPLQALQILRGDTATEEDCAAELEHHPSRLVILEEVASYQA